MKALRQLFALAAHAWRESVRMKSFLVLVLFAVCAIALSPFLPSDGTAQGRLKIAVSACMWSAAFFAAAIAVLLPAFLICREHDTFSIFLLAAKPVRPGMIILGKVGGAVMVGAVFLAAAGCLTWIVARVLAWDSPGMADDCLILRRSVRPVRETGAFLKPVEARADGVLLFPLPPGAEEARIELEGNEGDRVRVAFPKTDEAVDVVLRGQETPVPVPPAALGQETLEVRLTPRGARALLRAGRTASLAPGEKYEWEFRIPECTGGVRLRLRAYVGMTANFASHVELQGEGWSREEEVRFRPDRPSVLRLPAEAKGKLTALLVNESGLSVRVAEGRSAVLSVPAGSFAGGLVKDFLEELSVFVFVALGTAMAASFSSFPVAASWGLFLTIAGYMSGMVREVVSRPAVIVHHGHTHSEQLPAALSLVMGIVARATPDFSAHDPTEAIVEGTYFPWSAVLVGILSVAVLRGGVCGAIGWFVYSRRELGR